MGRLPKEIIDLAESKAADLYRIPSMPFLEEADKEKIINTVKVKRSAFVTAYLIGAGDAIEMITQDSNPNPNVTS